MAPDALRINPHGATLEVDGFFHTPLKLTLGQLHLGMVDRGSAKVKGQAGRFPILKRLSATAVVPREQGIEGWLWTSTGGSALTVVGDEDAAPTRRPAVHQAAHARAAQADDGHARVRGARRPLAARRARRPRPPVPRRTSPQTPRPRSAPTACCARSPTARCRPRMRRSLPTDQLRRPDGRRPPAAARPARSAPPGF